MKRIIVLLILILSLLFLISSSLFLKVGATTTLETCYSSICILSQDTLYESSISIPGEEDTFKFTLSTSGYYVIETYGDLDLIMKRYLAYNYYTNDNGGEKLNSIMGFSGTAGTQYTVYIKAVSSAVTGHYYVQVRRQMASIMTFDYGPGDIDTTPDAVTPIAELIPGYIAEDYQNVPENALNSDDYTGLNRFNKEVVMFSGHGNAGFVSIANSSYAKTYLYSTELPYMGNTKLGVWAACYSSKDSSTRNSMALQSVTNGAVSSIGWPDVTWVGSSRTFTNYLFKQLDDGKTVAVASSYAASKLLFWFDPIKDYEIFGDINKTISSTVNNKQDLLSYIPTFSTNLLTMLISENKLVQPDLVINEIIDDSSIKFKSVSLNYYLNGEQVHRYYRMYNGYATNEYYDILENSRQIINTSSMKISALDIKLMNSKSLPNFNLDHSKKILDEKNKYNLTRLESYKLYIKIDGELLPVIVYSIVMNNPINDEDIAFVKSYNLIDGSEIDYYSFGVEEE